MNKKNMRMPREIIAKAICVGDQSTRKSMRMTKKERRGRRVEH